jgi:predicted phage-related endonuclease
MQEYEIIEGEQKTDEWLKLRTEVDITGSIAKKVKVATNDFLYQLLAYKRSDEEPKEAFGEDIERGNELEPIAREEYEKQTKEKVRQVAFIKNGRYGLSPDGLVMKKDKIKKLIEIKAPRPKNHIRYILENKIPKEHIDQIIHIFLVCTDVDEVDFVSYCPQFKIKKLHIINIKRQTLIVDISTTRIQYENFTKKLDEADSKIVSLII